MRKKQLNLSFTQWLCLSGIKDDQGTSQNKLASLLSKEEASVSRLLKKLEDQKLIFKKRGDESLQGYKLYLAPEGVDLINKHQLAIHKIYKDIFNGIHDRELNLLLDILKRVSEKTKD